jgi:site-specific DNA-cytosine methylase
VKILVACEYSGRVRDAFTARGHYAMSCDILDTETEGPHYQGDVRDVLSKDWDMIIAFPPCTKLSCIGAAHWKRWAADGSQQDAIDFFMMFANAKCERVAVENPAGIISTRWRKPDQYINPFQFGEPWRKRTGLWLKGLPLLVPTNIVEPQGYWVDGGTYSRPSSPNYSKASTKAEGAFMQVRSPAEKRKGSDRAKDRSLTFQGIANAMAEQWG